LTELEENLGSSEFIEDFMVVADLDLHQMGLYKLTSRVTKSLLYQIYADLLTLYHNNRKLDLNDKRSYDLVRSRVSKLIGSCGWDVAHYFWEHVAATKPEVVRALGMNFQTVSRLVDDFVGMEFLEEYPAEVSGVYRPRRSRPIPIYGLIGVSPDDVLRAQRRYADSKLKSDKEQRFAEVKERMKEKRLADNMLKLESEADDWVERVKKYVDSYGCDVYDACRVLQVPVELRSILKEKIGSLVV